MVRKTKEIALPRCMWMILPLMMLLAASAEGQQESPGQATCLPPEYDYSARPDPEGVPTKVSIGIYVVDIVYIREAEQTFTVDFAFNVQWTDPRLAHQGRGSPGKYCRVRLHEVWHPHLTAINIRETKADDPDSVDIAADGTVAYNNRHYATVTSHFNLKEFPFDRQALTISLISEWYGPDEVAFVVDEGSTGRAGLFSLADWTIESWTTRRAVFDFVPGRQQLSQLDYEFEAVRLSQYYILKIILPLCLIIAMSWAVFWLAPTEPGPQMAVAGTVMLTLIVYLHRVGDLLPRVPYLTRLDEFLFGSVVLGFLAFSEAVTTAVLARRNKKALALTIDRWSRWLFPLGFAVNLGVSFWL